MSYTRVYTNRINWQNYPSVQTPLDEINLNKMDYALSQIDGTLADWDITKANQTDMLLAVKTIDFNDQTGQFTFTFFNGTTTVIDTLLEKIAINFDYDDDPTSAHFQNLIITLEDGTVKYIDMSALVTQYEFIDSSTMHFTIGSDGKVSVDIIDGSITGAKLEPNFLANCQAAEAAAEGSAEDAEAYAKGTRNGSDVPSIDPTYHNNSNYWAEQAEAAAHESVHTTFASLTDVNFLNLQEGQVPVSDANGQWHNQSIQLSIPAMTASALGIGRPDTITTTVDNSGTFSAKGVGIVADVNGSGTVHGADWLYYTGTTTVITPNASQMYRVTISGTASLWYWDGTQYVQLASSGGGGGASLVDVTTAQYNALTPAEKADPDVWYWINDMDGVSGTAIVIGTFAGLTDTNFTNLQNGQVAVYNATTQKWENQTPSGGVSDLDDLDDVSITSPASGQYLKYNGSNWENADVVIPSGDYYELVDGTNIASGTNLNNLTTVGTYTKRAQSFKATNEPSDLTQYERYNLIVQMADNTKTVTTGSPLMQILYAHTRNTGEIKVYTRGYTVPVGWSAWQSIGSGGSSGGDYMGLYGMTEIQSSDGQGSTAVDLNDYTTVGNYYCNGKALIQFRYYQYVGDPTGYQVYGRPSAVFLLYVRKISDTYIIQTLYVNNSGTLVKFERSGNYNGSTWGFTYWSIPIKRGSNYGGQPLQLNNYAFADVYVNSRETNDVLVYDKTMTRWENKPLSGYISNPNLLDNPWFTINQRGASSYTASNGIYTVDRWKLTLNGLGTGILTKNADESITIENQYASGEAYFIQPLDTQTISGIDGKTITVSVLFSDGTISSGTVTFNKGTSITILGWGNGMRIRLYSPTTSRVDFTIDVAKSSTVTIKAIKLELGSISTLALDTAPNYATELLKCQRYFQRIGKLSTSGYGKTITIGPAFTSSTIWMPFELSVPMRTHPVITITGRFLVTPSGANQKVSDTEHTLVISAPNFIETDTELLNIALDDSSNPFTVGSWYKLATYVASEVATINLSADL